MWLSSFLFPRVLIEIKLSDYKFVPRDNHRSDPTNLIQTFLTIDCDIIVWHVAATAAAANIRATTGRRFVGHSTSGARGGCDIIADIRLDADETCLI
jgi:hypothetical protein